MAHDETDKDAGWDTLRMELMDTLAVNWPIASWPEPARTPASSASPLRRLRRTDDFSNGSPRF